MLQLCCVCQHIQCITASRQQWYVRFKSVHLCIVVIHSCMLFVTYANFLMLYMYL